MIAAARRAATVVLMVPRRRHGDPKVEGPKAGVLRGVNGKADDLKGADPTIGRVPIAALMATSAVPMHAPGQMIVVRRAVVRRAVRLKVADLAPLRAGHPKVLAAAKKTGIEPAPMKIPKST